MLERIKRQNLKKILIIIWNVFRIGFLKIVKVKKINASLLQNIHPTTEIAISKGKLYLAHSIFTRKNVSFRVESGELSIGTSFFNQGCSITALQKIVIGEECLFGPNVIIVDHDHDYSYLNNQRGSFYKCEDVVIGNNVWVGGNVTILKGTTIGDNCVIGAGTIIRGDIPANTVVYSKQNQVMKLIP